MVEDHSDSEKGKEMFYLMTHSTHFIYGYILFNDALNTFFMVIWHQTYGKGPLR